MYISIMPRRDNIKRFIQAHCACVLLLLLCPALLIAMPDSAQIVQLNIENGMPSNNVYAILQDRNGYMWLSTDNGIAKYNGYNFKVFNTNDGLPTNEIYHIYEDSQHRLWMGYFSYEIGYIRDNKYHKINYKPRQRIMYNNKYYEKDGKVYFVHSDSVNNLVEVDANDSIKITRLRPNQSICFGSNKVFSSYTGNDVLEASFDKQGVRFRQICPYMPLFTYRESVQKIVFDSIIYGYRFKGKVANVYHVYDCKADSIDIKVFGASDSETIYMSEGIGNNAVILTNKALYCTNDQFKIRFRKSTKDLLGHEAQLSYYFIDSFKNQWYATNNEGVWLQTRISPVFKVNNSLQELAGAKYSGELKDGTTFWWNTNLKKMLVVRPGLQIAYTQAFNEDLYRISRSFSDSIIYLFFNYGSNDLYLYNLYTHKKSLFGMLRDTIVCYDYDNPAKRTVYTGSERLMMVKNFYTAYEYKPGVFYSFLRGVGIHKMTLEDNKIIIRTLSNDRFAEQLYDSLNDKFWFYNKEKIFLLDPKNDKSIVFNKQMLQALNCTGISLIRLDKFYNFYILLGKRLVMFNSRLKRFYYLPATFDLTDASIEVYDNVLLIAAKFGIAYAMINGPLSLSSVRIAPNIKEQYYNRIYGFKVNKAGYVIVTTNKGCYSFHLDELLHNASIFSSMDKNFMRLVVSYPQQRAVTHSDTFFLSQATDKVSFDAINYYGSGNRRYIYNIQGRKAWEQTDAGEVYVADLEPATYYKVQCVVKDDIWQSKRYTFYLYKLPYWYQTSVWKAVFWICGFLLFVVLLISIILLTKNIVARANEKKRLLTELELRAIYSQINPHFIFNTLGSALYFINKKQMDEAYLHVNKFSRLLRSYLKSSRNRYITLSEEIEMIKNYIELQQIRFEEKFEYHIEVENKVAANSIQIPSLLLQPLVENAINHGLFHLQEGKKGLLLIKFYQGASSDELVCVIEDNGVGREKTRELKKGSAAQYESYGTRLTEELIDIFRQYENMNIDIRYIDKQEPDTGTIVKLTIRNIKYVA